MEERDILSHPQNPNPNKLTISLFRKKRNENSVVSFGNTFTNFLLIANGKFALFSSLVSGHRKMTKDTFSPQTIVGNRKQSIVNVDRSYCVCVCLCCNFNEIK